MKLPRPYVPYSVRVVVAARQCIEANVRPSKGIDNWPDSRKLKHLLMLLFADEPVHLDHDPALENRPFDEWVAKYIPDANDPNHLIYRTVENHRVKTFVRGDGAQRSDTSQRRYLTRVEENRSGKPRAKISQRKNVKWPKRKFGKRHAKI